MVFEKKKTALESEYIKEVVEMVDQIITSNENAVIIGQSYNSDLVISHLEASECIQVSADELFQDGEVCMKKVKKILRRSIVAQCLENFKVVEGQITHISGGHIQLKTTDMESRFEIGPKIHEELLKERVSIGDVIKIYKEYGFIKRIGRALGIDNNNVNSVDLIQIPSGECIKVESTTTNLTLDEIDIINFKEDGVNYIMSNIYVDDDVQKEVNSKLIRWIKEKKITIKKIPILIENGDLLSEGQIHTIFEYSKSHLKFVEYNSVIVHSANAIQSARLFTIPVKKPSESDCVDILNNFIEYNKIVTDLEAVKVLGRAAVDKNIQYALDILDISRKPSEPVLLSQIEQNLAKFEYK